MTDGRHYGTALREAGVGMEPELRDRIFEPFFTTKDAATGTGLGLSISRNIVQEHGGWIEVESQPGQGSLFRVLLPPDRRPTSDTARAPVQSQVTERRLRVLVIDDDPLVLIAIQRVLTRAHEVTAVAGARAALDRLDTGTSYDVILCDLMMPDGTGMDFHKAILARDPDLAARIVFMTGGAFAPEARAFLSDVSPVCIEKPFSECALRSALLVAADRGSPSGR